MQDLAEIEAIKRLKHKYFRCLDSKLWDDLASCFAEDATSSYGDGKWSFQGRDKIMEFLTGAMSDHDKITMHQGHHPEIDLTGENTATAIWALEDYVLDLKANTALRGSALYTDEYVKVDGQWKIKHTGYRRVFAEVWNRSDTPSVKLRDSMFNRD